MTDTRLCRWLRRALLSVMLIVTTAAPALAANQSPPDQTLSLSVLYGITTALALLLLVLLLRFRRPGRPSESWLVVLFASVFVVDLGYLALSVSRSLQAAMIANTISYLGSVLLPLSMLLVIRSLCGIRHSRALQVLLCVVSTLMFLLAASGASLGLYYKEVSVVYVNGIAHLRKIYGPLHGLYLLYLLGYFGLMVGTIAYAIVKKRITTPTHAAILASIALGNIGIWYVEQKVEWDFEFLSLSYIICEVLLLLVFEMIRDYENVTRRLELLRQSPPPTGCSREADLRAVTAERAAQILSDSALVGQLTTREREVLLYLLQDKPRKEIAALLCVTENTVKKHTSNIFFKLEVSNRRDLLSKLE